jgi:uncharacterized BrkB/YihY/UPF0761 family membrane protein
MSKYEILGLTIGWILTIVIGLLLLIIVWKIWKDEIDLAFLISDELGYASLSRFQMLLFTFVIAMSLFYIIVMKSPPDFPAVPKEILALLGISGGSYVLSKGIQSSRDIGMTEAAGKLPTEAPDKPTNTPGEGAEPK